MNNRRDFLVKGSLAAAAMMVIKPFESIAGEITGGGFFGSEGGKLVFLHTPYLNPYHDHSVIQKINAIKSIHSNALLLNASAAEGNEISGLAYDASITDTTASAFQKEYKILKRGSITTGIISAVAGEKNVIDKVNRLAAYLKKEKRCNVVICLSSLGYKNENAPDDLTIAKRSIHLDMIIGGHAKNFHKHPVIALNSEKEEVIIHSAAGDTTDYGKIEIDFDRKGRKRQISFSGQA